MIHLIEDFLTSRQLSTNSQKAYRYDLKQFLALTRDQLTPFKLELYKQSVAQLSLSARKRKYSAVNQFLHYLYQIGYCDRFMQLDEAIRLQRSSEQDYQLRDLTVLEKESKHTVGQLIALLIYHLGLTPSQIAMLKQDDIDLNFNVLSTRTAKQVQVLSLPKLLPTFLAPFMDSQKTYLIEHHGQPYSRQWYFQQLRLFLVAVNCADLSAQSLRQQFILAQKAQGASLLAISQQLGLKSPVTLEKYFK
ncbi:site-specific tyrosine recombinase XerD [Streptococcus halichoeri]|uniref:site-specific tyrosine recombinase XerD n=1 Tax=Streptococcus halichoeri TaxID=254785 RepID=UPI00135CF0FE|nr:site-specific tyrosine recombinase XerD [Streptococcus halichoeri]